MPAFNVILKDEYTGNHRPVADECGRRHKTGN